MLKKLSKVFFLGIAAGVMIGIGGAVFLACSAAGGSIDKYVGAVMFSAGLLTVCVFGLYLFTGKICYLYDDCTACGCLSLPVGLLGNFVGATFVGIITSIASPIMFERAKVLAAAKLEMTWYNVIIMAFLCDILIFAAVHIYKLKGSVAGIFVAVPVFILCGFEHSVADMYYFGAARVFSGKSCLFLLLVVVGNALGGLFLPTLMKLGGKKNEG